MEDSSASLGQSLRFFQAVCSLCCLAFSFKILGHRPMLFHRICQRRSSTQAISDHHRPRLSRQSTNKVIKRGRELR